MKICFIIDNEKIFHPNFIYKTFSLINKKYNVEYSIGLVTKIPNKSNISRYLTLFCSKPLLPKVLVSRPSITTCRFLESTCICFGAKKVDS